MTLGLVFLFILTVDKPFKGPLSVDSREMAQLPQNVRPARPHRLVEPAPLSPATGGPAAPCLQAGRAGHRLFE